MKGGWILVLTTTSSVEEAEKVARGLLEKKLVACINIIRDVKSIYWWQGSIEQTVEALVVAKTRHDKLEAVEKTIRELHSYKVPEIIALPVVAGGDDYLGWLDKTIDEANTK